MEDGTENIFTWDACRYTFAANKNTEQCPDCGKFAVRGASAEEIENYTEDSNRNCTHIGVRP